MAEVKDYSYQHVYLSKALSATEEAAATASGVTLTGLTVAGGNITIGGQSIAMHDLKGQCEFIRPIERPGTQDVTTVDGDVRRELATQPRVEIMSEWLLDDDDDGVFGVIVHDRTGVRVLQIETDDEVDHKYTAVVNIFDVERLQQSGDTGAAMYSAIMRNFGRTKPVWER